MHFLNPRTGVSGYIKGPWAILSTFGVQVEPIPGHCTLFHTGHARVSESPKYGLLHAVFEEYIYKYMIAYLDPGCHTHFGILYLIYT